MTDPPPLARTSTRRHVSFIWIIPLVAIAIGIWLAWDTLSKEGPTITVTFESGEGLQPGQSQLKFKDIVFGTVKDVRLSADHTHVLVKIATIRQAKPLLTDKTIFWVAKPRLFAGNISGLSTVFSGAYVEMLPPTSGGRPAQKFVGHEDPPVLGADVPGHTFLLKADRLGSISLGSPVYFHDLDVGEVLGWDLSDMAESVTIHAFIRAPFDAYVHDDTRFWNASGISVKLAATGVSVQVESLRALILGGIAFETPIADQHSPVSPEDHVFPLFPDRDAAENASYTRTMEFISYFPGSVRGLGPGSEVTFQGLLIGHVTDVRLKYDPATNSVLVPVRYEVQPGRVVGVGKRVYATKAEAVAALLNHGMRASLQTASLITGQKEVALEFVPHAPSVAVTMEGSDFVVPTTPGGGFASLQASAGDLLDKVKTIPFQQIGDNLNQLIASMNKGYGDKSAFKNNVNRLITSANTNYVNNSEFQYKLDRLLAELTDAARSMRSLADLLQRHPEVLIRGRNEQGKE